MPPNLSVQGRYLLFLDILGFTKLVEDRDPSDVYGVIDEALQEFDQWEKLNGEFRTLYFSDTFLFYQTNSGYYSSAFMDVYAIGSIVLTALLAKGIPARGAITFGQFEVRDDVAKRRQVYFGRALIDAYKAEQQENWIGITIQRSAWEPWERSEPGSVAAFAREGVWLQREIDGVLLLNPFMKLRGWYLPTQIGEVNQPYRNWDAPVFPNEIKALAFLEETAKRHVEKRDFTGREAAKYHASLNFLKGIIPQEIYTWAREAYLQL